jgi:hypothetical protein
MSPDIPPALFAEAVDVDISDLDNIVTGRSPEQIDAVPANATGLYCEEPGCGVTLTYSGRGRKPKKCPAHRRSGSSASDKAPKSSAPRGTAKIKEDVSQLAYILGMSIAPYDSYDAAVLIGTAPKLADTVATLAVRYPAFRKWLDKGGDGMMWFNIVLGFSATVVPILAHHNVIPMDEREAYKRFVDPNVSVD